MIWILDIGVRMYLNKLILIFLILTILLLLIYCEKIVEPTIKEIFITRFDVEGMRKEHLSNFRTVRKRARFNEGREFVFQELNDKNNVVLFRVGIHSNSLKAQKIAEEYNSWCWIPPQEDTKRVFGIGDKCWWMRNIDSSDTVAYHFIRHNMFIIVNSHSYHNLLQLTRSIDNDILNNANYTNKANSISLPIIQSISASKTELREGDTAKITINASDPNNEPLEYVCIGLAQPDSNPINVFTIEASRGNIADPFWGSHTYKFQVINGSNILSESAEITINISQ